MASVTAAKLLVVFTTKAIVHEQLPGLEDQLDDIVGSDPEGDATTGPLSGTADAGSSGAALITTALGG